MRARHWPWSPRTRTFVSHEDPQSIREKGACALRNGLRGVMFWRYDADYRNELLDAIGQSLSGSSATGSVG